MATGWEAVYNDKSTLKQFNDDGSENSFGTIKQDELFEFRLYHRGKIISLFMPTGTFGINGFLYDTDVSRMKDVNYRLIYFVRRRKIMGQGKETNTHFIGFQITIDEKNVKQMINICDDVIQLGGQ